MKTFKTPKGTELPLINLKGKDYLQVAHRLVWFREEHPDWSIRTGVRDGLFRAEIFNEKEFCLATAHKSISERAYSEESAETGAIGRALALCGFGTQFAGDELDEKDEIADSPIATKKGRDAAEKPAYSQTTRDLNTPRGGVSEKQLKRLYAISKESGWTEDECKEYLAKLGLKGAKDLNLQQYDHFCKLMQDFPRHFDKSAGGDLMETLS